MGVFNKVKASNKGGDAFAVPPAGNQAAVCVALVDLGTQTETYQGVTKEARKVFIAWELTDETNPDTGENFVVGRDYTLSLNQKATLRGIIEKWRGRALAEDEEFDLPVLLGKPCLLALVHKQNQAGDRTYAKIDGVGQIPKGMKAGKATKAPFLWEMGDDKPLPEWLPRVYGELASDVIARSAEAKGGGDAVGAAAGGDASDGNGDGDTIPF